MKYIALFQVAFVVTLITVCAFLNVYSIETIGGYCGKDIDFPLWAGALLSFVPGLGQACIPVAAIVFVVGFFI